MGEMMCLVKYLACFTNLVVYHKYDILTSPTINMFDSTICCTFPLACTICVDFCCYRLERKIALHAWGSLGIPWHTWGLHLTVA